MNKSNNKIRVHLLLDAKTLAYFSDNMLCEAELVSKISLIDYLRAQSELYCECPCCRDVFRLNEARLMFGKSARRDLLDRIRRLREEFEVTLIQERADARKRSRAVSKGFMLKHICPYLPTFAHHPRDARFLGDPVDFVIFDGIFRKGRVSSLTTAEIKSGSSKLTAGEKVSKEQLRKAKSTLNRYE